MRGNCSRRNVNLCHIASTWYYVITPFVLASSPIAVVVVLGEHLWSGSMWKWPGGPNGVAGGKPTGPGGAMGGCGGGGGVNGGGAMDVVGSGKAAGVERCPLAQDSAIARAWSWESSGLAARTIAYISSSNRICRRAGSSVRAAGAVSYTHLTLPTTPYV